MLQHKFSWGNKKNTVFLGEIRKTLYVCVCMRVCMCVCARACVPERNLSLVRAYTVSSVLQECFDLLFSSPKWHCHVEFAYNYCHVFNAV